MNSILRLAVTLLLAFFIGNTHAESTSPLTLYRSINTPLGLYISHLREGAHELTLDQAITAYQQGHYVRGNSQVLNFGIGSHPVWLHLKVVNPTAQPLLRRLSIDTAWLDQINLYQLRNYMVEKSYYAGDSLPFSARITDSRYYEFDLSFAPGDNELYIRVQTPDPMVIPLYLQSQQDARHHESLENFTYAFLYGFLAALLAYNLMLYAGLRDSRYLLYSIYLGLFLLMNISYTGHGSEWLWPNNTAWAQWSNPLLMVLYGISGLLFALRFLDIHRHFPRIYKGVIGYIAAGIVLELLASLFHSQRYALLVSFSFVFIFTTIMLALGVISLRSGQTPARYFLLAAIAAIIGAASTALSVWGFIPTNIWTYRAVDIGITIEATLLALALTYQFRLSQEQKLHAEQLASLDPLTGLNNRRAFYSQSAPFWGVAQRHDSALSVILLDIDNFKAINDTFGHASGDEVIVATAGILKEAIREQDVVARWGGEEFILLLPETDMAEAVTLAERLRHSIENRKQTEPHEQISFTASFGVAQRGSEHQTLEALINEADHYLYHAKETGRNRVSYAGLITPEEVPVNKGVLNG